MAPSVLAKGSVTCGVCGSEFVVDRGVTRSRPLDTDPAMTAAAGRPPVLTEDATDRAERLLGEAGRGVDGLDVVMRLGAWRGRLDTEAERPIPVASEHDADRWEQLARAVLTVDGWLTGPAMELRDGLEVRAGDRLIVRPSVDASLPDDLPDPGATGIVTSVRCADGVAMVDFASAGVYEVGVGSREASALGYDYCEVEPVALDAAPVAADAASAEPDVGADW